MKLKLSSKEELLGVDYLGEEKITNFIYQQGSESTNSNYISQRKISSNKNRRELIPLDELLNNTFDENAFTVDRSVSPTIELETTKAKLSVQESRYV